MSDSKNEAEKEKAVTANEQTPQVENPVELQDDELDMISGGKITGMNKSTDITLKRGTVGVIH